MTNGIHIELARQGTPLVAVHASFIDTMAVGIDVPEISTAEVAAQVLDAVEAGRLKVLADKRIRQVKASLSRDHELIYLALQPRGMPAT